MMLAMLKPVGRPSLALQRHDFILSQLRRLGTVRVADLAAQLEVSEMTVRRDLDTLDEAKALVKVHGGATMRYEHSAEEPGFVVKSQRNTPEKSAIAASAAALVAPGSAIGITAGTTTTELARELVNVPQLTVVTNCIRVAEMFFAAERADRTVVLTGGQRTPSDALVGPVAVSSLARFQLDQVFLGVHGMHPSAGFTTPNLLEADTNVAFVASTRRLIVLADHSKWNVVGLCSIAPLDDAAVVITDDGLAAEAQECLAARAGRLIVSATDFNLGQVAERA